MNECDPREWWTIYESITVISNVPDCSTNLILHWTSISTFKKLFLRLFRLKQILNFGIVFL